MKTTSTVPEPQKVLEAHLPFLAPPFLSRCIDHSGVFSRPWFYRSLYLQTAPCCFCIRADGQFSPCGHRYSAGRNLYILDTFFLCSADNTGAFSRRVTDAIQFNMETLLPPFPFLAETLPRLFVPPLSENLRGACLAGVPADVFCEGLFLALHK